MTSSRRVRRRQKMSTQPDNDRRARSRQRPSRARRRPWRANWTNQRRCVEPNEGGRRQIGYESTRSDLRRIPTTTSRVRCRRQSPLANAQCLWPVGAERRVTQSGATMLIQHVTHRLVKEVVEAAAERLDQRQRLTCQRALSLQSRSTATKPHRECRPKRAACTAARKRKLIVLNTPPQMNGVLVSTAKKSQRMR